MQHEASMGSTVSLRDGRTLGFVEYGDPTGTPVIFCHGTPGSRRYSHPDASIPLAVGARVIAVDRPGYGLSTFEPRRRLLDWPDDVAQLADNLGIGRFSVVGISGGGPHALACALKLGDRLTRVGLVASAAPLDIPGATAGMSRDNRRNLAITRAIPYAVLRVLYGWQVAAEMRDPAKWLDAQSGQLADADRIVRTDPAWRKMELDNVREAYQQGARAHAWEGRVLTQPWGFAVADVASQVHLWQGEADTLVPQTLGRFLAATLPNCVPAFLSGEGHLSLFYNHWRAVLATMVA
jgi:pimeloyl-ACP methyl ester carboxylesterase